MYNTWVKNVYNLRTLASKSSGIVSTRPHLLCANSPVCVYRTWFFPAVILQLSPQLYTPIFQKLHLLLSRLYTVSTAPTITETKEKKERNT